ncbi:hypothetical protein EON64_20755, partial [archaeon]
MEVHVRCDDKFEFDLIIDEDYKSGDVLRMVLEIRSFDETALRSLKVVLPQQPQSQQASPSAGPFKYLAPHVRLSAVLGEQHREVWILGCQQIVSGQGKGQMQDQMQALSQQLHRLSQRLDSLLAGPSNPITLPTSSA